MIRPVLGSVDTLLEVAPSPRSMQQLATTVAPRRHIRLDAGHDARSVNVLGSLTELPFVDGCVDLLVCYHVLEHIPDDRAAMREIARVLAPGGLAILQVPFRRKTLTDEDPSASPEERLRRFGQADHVRYYGDDFEDRLVAAGLFYQRITPMSTLGPAAVRWFGLVPTEPVWLVRNSVWSSSGVVDEQVTSLTTMLDVVLDELDTSRRHNYRLRARLRRLQGVASSAPPPVEPPGPSAGGLRVRLRRPKG